MNPQNTNNANVVKTTPKDFFLHLTATVVLYIAVGMLINLAFSIINYAFPDALAGYFFGNSVAWPISMLVVLVPVLYIVEWLIKKDIKAMPEKAGLAIRRWRIYLTLFLTGAVLAGDLIALINIYLNGEISVRFIYKFLAILVVLGIVFTYFLLEKTGKSAKIKTTMVYAGIVVALASIVGGFLIVGTPGHQRDLRFDSQRVGDLQNIQWQVLNYWQQKGKLPVTLKDLNDPLSGSIIPMDPETKADYGYSVKTPLSFELCADFATDYKDTKGRGEFGYGRGGGIAYDTSYPVGDYGYENWQYKVGKSCFTRTIDPEKYPPIPTPKDLKTL